MYKGQISIIWPLYVNTTDITQPKNPERSVRKKHLRTTVFFKKYRVNKKALKHINASITIQNTGILLWAKY
jgi:hypothetical protein